MYYVLYKSFEIIMLLLKNMNTCLCLLYKSFEIIMLLLKNMNTCLCFRWPLGESYRSNSYFNEGLRRGNFWLLYIGRSIGTHRHALYSTPKTFQIIQYCIHTVYWFELFGHLKLFRLSLTGIFLIKYSVYQFNRTPTAYINLILCKLSVTNYEYVVHYNILRNF